MKFAFAILLVIFTLLIGGCGPKLDISPQEVQTSIEAALSLGDDRSKIESYFEEQGLPFSYDRFSSRYQSIIRHPDSNFHAIVIYVNVDEEQRFLSAEAHDSYTAL